MLALGALVLPNTLFVNSLYPQQQTLHKVRVGLRCVGLRGQNHLELLAKRDDVEVVAFADPSPIMLKKAQEFLVKNNKPKAQEFSNGDYDYRNLLQLKNIDTVVISTPWEWHHKQGIEAMQSKKKSLEWKSEAP